MGAKPRRRSNPILIRRAYDPPDPAGGPRYLVDRLWPRGIRKEELGLAGWLRDVAPSDELRRWFAHDPARWPAFQRRYAAELDAHPDSWRELADAARAGTVTLVFGARDPEHNNAAALAAYLRAHL